MLNRKQHEMILSQLLFDIYNHPQLRTLLGFKGGTACYFFYELPRFSVDLDFNLLDIDHQQVVFDTVQNIASEYGELKDVQIKFNTIFFLLSYETHSYNIKIEISTRGLKTDKYEVKQYRGLPVLVMQQPYISAHKLVAITDRKAIVNRDLFDAHFFLKQQWPIDEQTIHIRTGKTMREYMQELILVIEREQQAKRNMLQGIGELLDEKQKAWVKTHLLNELLFLLRVYIDE